ncbi:MAG TPA: clostripain-related cysteine peptidase [Vicinamibacterales bacterium]|nr:clostripain-related cysteine peptidase [Vicinamibacterales bacterium]
MTRSAKPAQIGSTLLADLGPTNTGDPGVLKDFISFGVRRYPARATMLLLSNHGSGFWVPPEMLSGEGRRPRRRGRGLRHGSFQPTREGLLAPDPVRGIAYDDGSGDCLDNRELKQVVAHAHRVLGRPVDVVGMDACLMTMLEVAYQLREHARILVGSEELEPGAGWPHATILGDLVARPAMTPAELGAAVVRRYAEFYGTDGPDITQSAIDLGKLDDLVGAVDRLARVLLGALSSSSLELALYRAWRQTLRFFDDLYADLHHFAVNLAAATTRRDVRNAAIAVQRAIEAEDGPVIAERHGGRRMAPARGLSIYFPPFRDPAVFYRELDFARRTRWADFLDAYMGAPKGIEA